jgi:hypothetical protein
MECNNVVVNGVLAASDRAYDARISARTPLARAHVRPRRVRNLQAEPTLRSTINFTINAIRLFLGGRTHRSPLHLTLLRRLALQRVGLHRPRGRHPPTERSRRAASAVRPPWALRLPAVQQEPRHLRRYRHPARLQGRHLVDLGGRPRLKRRQLWDAAIRLKGRHVPHHRPTGRHPLRALRALMRCRAELPMLSLFPGFLLTGPEGHLMLRRSGHEGLLTTIYGSHLRRLHVGGTRCKTRTLLLRACGSEPHARLCSRASHGARCDRGSGRSSCRRGLWVCAEAVAATARLAEPETELWVRPKQLPPQLGRAVIQLGASVNARQVAA